MTRFVDCHRSRVQLLRGHQQRGLRSWPSSAPASTKRTGRPDRPNCTRSGLPNRSFRSQNRPHIAKPHSQGEWLKRHRPPTLALDRRPVSRREVVRGLLLRGGYTTVSARRPRAFAASLRATGPSCRPISRPQPSLRFLGRIRPNGPLMRIVVIDGDHEAGRPRPIPEAQQWPKGSRPRRPSPKA